MKKLLQKRKNNKGFSLVELIVVVAIMAVLIGVLVPTLVRNVEKSKKQKDVSAVEEVRNQMQVALADEKFSSITGTIECTGGNIALNNSIAFATDDVKKAYIKEVCQNLAGEDATSFSKQLSSKAYGAKTVTFTITNEKVTAVINVSATETVTVGD